MGPDIFLDRQAKLAFILDLRSIGGLARSRGHSRLHVQNIGRNRGKSEGGLVFAVDDIDAHRHRDALGGIGGACVCLGFSFRAVDRHDPDSPVHVLFVDRPYHRGRRRSRYRRRRCRRLYKPGKFYGRHSDPAAHICFGIILLDIQGKTGCRRYAALAALGVLTPGGGSVDRSGGRAAGPVAACHAAAGTDGAVGLLVGCPGSAGVILLALGRSGRTGVRDDLRASGCFCSHIDAVADHALLQIRIRAVPDDRNAEGAAYSHVAAGCRRVRLGRVRRSVAGIDDNGVQCRAVGRCCSQGSLLHFAEICFCVRAGDVERQHRSDGISARAAGFGRHGVAFDLFRNNMECRGFSGDLCAFLDPGRHIRAGHSHADAGSHAGACGFL